MIEVSFFAAFLAGFLGGAHCLGMCGGVVTALTAGSISKTLHAPRQLFWINLGYNTGRMSAYVLAGIIVGGFSGLFALSDLFNTQIVFSLVGGVFMILMGTYLSGWWMGLAKVEALGYGLWKCIEPLALKLMPVNSFGGAVKLGFFWGWIPCGLVYSVLIMALSTGNPLDAGLLMLAFALGTLPNLMLMGVFAIKVKQFLHKPWVKWTAGGVVMIMGLLTLMHPLMVVVGKV